MDRLGPPRRWLSQQFLVELHCSAWSCYLEYPLFLFFLFHFQALAKSPSMLSLRLWTFSLFPCRHAVFLQLLPISLPKAKGITLSPLQPLSTHPHALMAPTVVGTISFSPIAFLSDFSEKRLQAPFCVCFQIILSMKLTIQKGDPTHTHTLPSPHMGPGGPVHRSIRSTLSQFTFLMQ